MLRIAFPLLAAAAALLTFSQALAGDRTILDFCEQEWKDNYVMRLACVEAQTEAMARIEAMEAHSAAASMQIDGVWGGYSTVDIAFLGSIKVSGGDILLSGGTMIQGQEVVATPEVRVLGDLAWKNWEKLLNPICGGVAPKTLAIVVEPRTAGEEITVSFFTKAIHKAEDAASLGQPCDIFRLVRQNASWQEIVNPSPDVRAVETCQEYFGRTNSPDLAECVMLEREALTETATFIEDPKQKAAYDECRGLLRGRGSMDFNPTYIYLACARAEGRKEVVERCLDQFGVERAGGFLRGGEGAFAVEEAQACIGKNLGILSIW